MGRTNGGDGIMASKPDYLDFDGDGNKKEPMKQALAQKKPQKKMGGGKIYAMSRNMGGPIRKPRMK